MEQLQLAINFYYLEAWEKAVMKTRLFFIILFVSLAQSGNVYADNVTYPPSYNNIAAGNPAKASDVTDAFTAVKSAVDANDGLINNNISDISTNTTSIADHETRIGDLEAVGATIYDYHDYNAASTITTRTYQWYRSEPTTTCNTEVHQLIRTVIDANTTDITLRRILSVDGITTCQIREFDYTKTADNYVHKETRAFNPDGTPGETYTFLEPVILRTAKMQIGVPIVSTTEVQSTVNSHMIEINTLLGNESVTVPAGTYTDCIKIHKRRNAVISGHDQTAISWYCAGIGLVKRIRVVNNSSLGQISQSLELVSTN